MIKRLYERWILNPKAGLIARHMRAHPEAWGDSGCLFLSCGRVTVIADLWWFTSIFEPAKEKFGIVGRTLVWWAAKPIVRTVKRNAFAANDQAISEIRR